VNELRIFICYYPEETPNAATPIMQQLAQDLQKAGATFIIETANQSDNEFVQFITRELPTCQWIIFAQTPATLQASRTSLLYNAALKFVEQGTLEGMIRVIPGPEDNTVPVPAALSALDTYNLYEDYPKTLEKLLFFFSIHDSDKIPTQLPGRRSISAHKQISNPKENSSRPKTSASQFDHPTLSPPRQPKFRSRQAWISRKALIISTISILAVIAIIAALFIYLTPKPSQPVPNPVVGYAYFTSSALIKGTGTDGIDDGINITLNNLVPPVAGNSYYAWLLPDVDSPEGNPLRLKPMPPLENGTTQIIYTSPNGSNLLSLGSRILITEENASVEPSTPNLDKNFWRYYAAIPQNTSGTDNSSNMSDMSSMTHLDHLRHLLYLDPELNARGIKGGSAYWFLNNTNYINLLAANAWTNRNVRTLQADAVSMLTYIDGTTDVSIDVTNKTILTNNTQGINQQAVKVGLLNLNNEHDNPPGYVKYMQTHLGGYNQAPGTTPDEAKQVLQLSNTLNEEGDILQQMRLDAIKLLNATEAVKITKKNNNPTLGDSNTNTILSDLYAQSTAMYNGTFDPASGNRVGGSLWIFDHIQHLASLTIEKYNGQ
jgi:hypothetical protein